MFGQREVFVPLAGALVSDGLVEVPFSTELVKRAPLATDDPHLTPDQEAAILRHYGLPFILPEPSSLNVILGMNERIAAMADNAYEELFNCDVIDVNGPELGPRQRRPGLPRRSDRGSPAG